MTEPRPLVEGVDRMLAELGAPPVDTLATVLGVWDDLPGEPVSVEHGRLLVRVTDPAVAEHLRWSERTILDRLAAAVGPQVVDRIEVRVRP